MVFAVSPFRVRKGNLKYSGMLDIHSERVATSSGLLAETFQTVSTEIQLRVEIGEAWPSVRTVLPWRPDVFNAEASRHYGAFGRLQRLVWTVAQEPTILTSKLHGIFMDIFLETYDHTHGMKWDTVHIIWRLLIEPIILLKSNHYIKCFCQQKCCQYKILTHMTWCY